MQKTGIDFAAIPGSALRVLATPAAFFKEMPKSGGFAEPLVFMVAMGVIAGLIQSIVSLLGLNIAAGMLSGMFSVIVVPIMVAVFGFIGAALLFVIWKLLGSQESYETAYRCGAYLGALSPIYALLSLIPYVGGALGILLMTYYLVQASVSAHGIASSKAWMVFGIIGALFIVTTVSMEIAARRMAGAAKGFQEEMEKAAKEMEKSGKGMQEQLEKFQQEAEKLEKKMKQEGR